MKVNLRAAKAGDVVVLSPRAKRWILRALLFLVVSGVLSQSPYLLLAVQSWLLGHWGVIGKAYHAAVKLRLKRRVPNARPNSPAEA